MILSCSSHDQHVTVVQVELVRRRTFVVTSFLTVSFFVLIRHPLKFEFPWSSKINRNDSWLVSELFLVVRMRTNAVFVVSVFVYQDAVQSVPVERNAFQRIPQEFFHDARQFFLKGFQFFGVRYAFPFFPANLYDFPLLLCHLMRWGIGNFINFPCITCRYSVHLTHGTCLAVEKERWNVDNQTLVAILFVKHKNLARNCHLLLFFLNGFCGCRRKCTLYFRQFFWLHGVVFFLVK